MEVLIDRKMQLFLEELAKSNQKVFDAQDALVMTTDDLKSHI